jgi:NADPH2:quinone reductase
MVRLSDVAEPAAAPNEVLIEVEAFSINRGETFQLENPQPGWRPGKDVVGRVTRVAGDGTGPSLGTRVVGHPAANGWAEYAAVATNRLAVVPDGMKAELAAALPLAGLTALRLLRTVGSLVGRRVLLTGAAGGVGHFFVELGAATGAEISVVVGSLNRGHRLLELGATNVSTDIANAPAENDVVLESVGGSSLVGALDRLAPRGLLVWFGQASRIPPTIDFFEFFKGHRSATIRHFDYTDSAISDADDLATLVRLVNTDRLHPEIGIIDRWTNTAARIRDLRERRILGKAILTLT